MGLLLSAFLFSCLVACSPIPLIVLVELGVRRLAGAKSRRSAVWQFLRVRDGVVVAIILTSLAVAVLLTWPLVQIFLQASIREGTHATYDEARGMNLHALPKCARDINFYGTYMGATADFIISEEDFLKWCDDQGWSPQEIRRDELDWPVNVEYRGHPERDCEVHDGFVCHVEEHPRGTGFHIVYDRDSGRAYYNFSSW